jgi:cytoskeletal protein CcmA (bactofilin family)
METTRTTTPASSKQTVLNTDTEFKGSLAFTSELQLNGRMEGTISSEAGTLTVGETAIIKADIKTKDAVIYGKVQGNITVQGRAEIRGKGQVYGDIKCSSLLVENSAVFVGRSETLNASKADFEQIFTHLTPAAKANGSH